MKNLFTYGTLMCDEIMHAVAGHRFSSVHAVLNGYSRRGIKQEVYPAIFAESNGRVVGVLYRDVPQSAWVKLDEYEGDMYSRDSVVVELNDGVTLPADTYVIKSSCRRLLAEDDWDYEYFLHHHKKHYLKSVR